MGYSKDIFDAAMETLSDRRNKANREAEARRQVIRERLPRAIAIEREISKAGLQTARIILAGGVDVKSQIEKLAEQNLSLQKEFAQLMEANGYSSDYMEPRFCCKKCNDEGFSDGIMCDCLRSLMQQEAYKKLNRLSPLELCSFDNFDLSFYDDQKDESGHTTHETMEVIYQFCRNYANQFDGHSTSILMTGATGLGKTHLSLSIAKEVIAKGYGVVYGSTQNFMSELEKEKFGRVEDNDSLQPLLDCDLLILDDLGTEFITPFVSSTIYNLINNRLMTDKPTIISTNLSLLELERRYSERIVSRIIGNYRMMRFLGKDIRQLKREALSKR